MSILDDNEYKKPDNFLKQRNYFLIDTYPSGQVMSPPN